MPNAISPTRRAALFGVASAMIVPPALAQTADFAVFL
jgi:hypothetical protein